MRSENRPLEILVKNALDQNLLLLTFHLNPYLVVVIADVLTRGDAVTEPEVVCRRMHTMAKMTKMRPELKMGTRIITANGMASSTCRRSSLATSGTIVGWVSPTKMM